MIASAQRYDPIGIIPLGGRDHDAAGVGRSSRPDVVRFPPA